MIDESNIILEDLKNKKIDLAMKWCQENKSKLQKINSSFELCSVFANIQLNQNIIIQ